MIQTLSMRYSKITYQSNIILYYFNKYNNCTRPPTINTYKNIIKICENNFEYTYKYFRLMNKKFTIEKTSVYNSMIKSCGTRLPLAKYYFDLLIKNELTSPNMQTYILMIRVCKNNLKKEEQYLYELEKSGLDQNHEIYILLIL